MKATREQQELLNLVLRHRCGLMVSAQADVDELYGMPQSTKLLKKAYEDIRRFYKETAKQGKHDFPVFFLAFQQFADEMVIRHLQNNPEIVGQLCLLDAESQGGVQ